MRTINRFKMISQFIAAKLCEGKWENKRQTGELINCTLQGQKRGPTYREWARNNYLVVTTATCLIAHRLRQSEITSKLQ